MKHAGRNAVLAEVENEWHVGLVSENQRAQLPLSSAESSLLLAEELAGHPIRMRYLASSFPNTLLGNALGRGALFGN